MIYQAFRLLIRALTVCCLAPAIAAAGEPDPLFSEHSLLDIRIMAPFRHIMSARPTDDDNDNKNDPRGMLSITAADAETIEFPVRLVTRGNNRLDVCPFAPLRLDFSKDDLSGTVLDGQNKLKLVTHCRNDSNTYQQAVIREYLAYRILNILTDHSYRVRLLRITYDYSDDVDTQEKTYAFLIESNKRLANRIGKKEQEIQSVNFEVLDRKHANLISVFQYLIGNVDYSPVTGGSDDVCCHNSTLFSADESRYWSIPYDFDSTGWVEAPHIILSPTFGQSHIRQRVYRGRCHNQNLLPDTLRTFTDKRGEIEALINAQAELDSGRRNRLLDYVDDFYEEIDDEGRFVAELTKGCRD